MLLGNRSRATASSLNGIQSEEGPNAARTGARYHTTPPQALGSGLTELARTTPSSVSTSTSGRRELAGRLRPRVDAARSTCRDRSDQACLYPPSEPAGNSKKRRPVQCSARFGEEDEK